MQVIVSNVNWRNWRRFSRREAAVRKLLTAIFFGVLLSVGTGMESAHSEEATFKLTNSAPKIIWVKLFSQTRRGWQWPSASRHWILERWSPAHFDGWPMPAWRKDLLWRII
jgi:hypothetical protein